MRLRAQVLPVFAIMLGVIATVAMFFFNVTVLSSSAAVAIDGAVRSGAIAALQAIDRSAGYERWEIDPDAADTAARDVVERAIVGDPDVSAGTWASLFSGDVAGTIWRTSGTSGDTNPGLDVEVLVPAVNEGQVSEAYLNGDLEAAAICTPAGIYPQGIQSTLSGDCLQVSAVVLHLRLEANQVNGASDSIARTSVARAGTNDAP